MYTLKGHIPFSASCPECRCDGSSEAVSEENAASLFPNQETREFAQVGQFSCKSMSILKYFRVIGLVLCCQKDINYELTVTGSRIPSRNGESSFFSLIFLSSF